MRAATAMIASVFIILGAGAADAGADTEPVIVVPGRPGIPIIINGQDVSGAVIEGDWGLGRYQTGLTIIKPPLRYWRGVGGPGLMAPPAGFYPATGRPPKIGRLEVLPAKGSSAASSPPQTYYRTWDTESPSLPPTMTPTYPYGMPPISYGMPPIVAPAGRRGNRPQPTLGPK
jgi:hypothetical protein